MIFIITQYKKRLFKVIYSFKQSYNKISDRDRIRTYDRLVRNQMLYPAELRDLFTAERQGFEPWRRLHVDRLAICSITTLAPLQKDFTNLDKKMT